MPPSEAAAQMVRQRRVFQSGLLAWLRGDAAGAKTMHHAVAAIAQVTATPTITPPCVVVANCTLYAGR